ncbi:MAG: hypothetical protein EXQ71_07410 [Acidimicrobiia bacterium]|nr:hypothetical protein [Acidimicrobiia bacterium]
MTNRSTFVWGLKRSGNHLIANWLYANHGGVTKDPPITDGLHRQFCDGFVDPAAGVAFYNNCGRLHSRRFELGTLGPNDFRRAAQPQRSAIFSIEDCSLSFAVRTAGIAEATSVLILRDPLNTLSSRLAAAQSRPELFPVDEGFVDLLDTYCAEALDHTQQLPAKVVISFNRFVEDPAYRDALAEQLGFINLDAVSEVSSYGGGSSFSSDPTPSPTHLLMTRFQQHPVSPWLLELLLTRSSVQEACTSLFGYDLADHMGNA